MQTNSLRKLLDAIFERGRGLRETRASRQGPWPAASASEVGRLCHELMSGRGEASAVAIARDILDRYARLSEAERLEFFRQLAAEFGPDDAQLDQAWSAYAVGRTPDLLIKLLAAVEPRRQELFRRLNRAPNGTSDLVRLREHLLAIRDPELAPVDHDLVHLFVSWFNRGFLTIQRIAWTSPADVLERIIRYEAVHRIRDWADLRRRLEPSDRRCYAFFHPALVDEPLIFVEVALTREIPNSIQDILAEERDPLAAQEATTAVFYSISNCQAGLRGISFGNFLIKQVVQELSRDLPRLKTFITLSPVPSLRRWLNGAGQDPTACGLDPAELSKLELLENPDWPLDETAVDELRPILLRATANYLARARHKDGQALDPVARFHLGNGARLEQIQWLADTSAKGLAESAGLMVNYLYDLRTIEQNHEAYENSGVVAASNAVTRHLKQPARAAKRKPAYV